jgi:hypothetical protein
LEPWVETHGYPPGSLRDLEKPTRTEHQGKAREKLKAEMKRKRLRIEDCGLWIEEEEERSTVIPARVFLQRRSAPMRPS